LLLYESWLGTLSDISCSSIDLQGPATPRLIGRSG
jgi:hypothetical protein